MKRRRAWMIALLVLAGLAAVLFWLAQNTYWERASVQGMPARAVLTDPLFVQQRIGSELGADVATLEGWPLPPADVTLLLYRWNWGADAGRSAALRAWVEQGGNLIVDRSSGFSVGFEQWSGLVRRDLQPAQLREAQQRARAAAEDGVDCQVLGQRYPLGGDAAGWRLCGAADDSVLEVPASADLVLADESGAQLVRVRRGRGSVTYINASAWTFKSLLQGDNAALYVLATRLGPGARLRFLRGDGGLPTLLGLLWSRGAAVLLLLVLAVLLGLWRAAVRFGPLLPAPANASRSLREQLRGSAQFLARSGGEAELWQASVQALRAALARHAPHGVMAQTGAVPRGVDAALWRQVQELLRAAGPPPAARLEQALASIEAVRRCLLPHSSTERGSP